MLANSFISIHAPPRGATWIAWRDPYYYIFQFTPLREGRLLPTRRKPMQTNFNSRPSARGDERKKGKQASAGISIHAPPRGATRCDFSPFELCSISIHAPPRGATSSRTQSVRCSFRFQFTPLREGRLSHRPHRRTGLHFNSRPSARGDVATGGSSRSQRYFNSRPSARGDRL